MLEIVEFSYEKIYGSSMFKFTMKIVKHAKNRENHFFKLNRITVEHFQQSVFPS